MSPNGSQAPTHQAGVLMQAMWALDRIPTAPHHRFLSFLYYYSQWQWWKSQKKVWLSTWQQICSLYNSINLHTVRAMLSMIISQFLRLYKFSVVYKYSDFSASRHFSESPLRQREKPPQYCLQGLVAFARWLCRVLLTKSLKRLI